MPLPPSEIFGRLYAYIAGRGVRITAQRKTILEVVETTSGQLDAAKIFRRARKLNPSINRSTVYRTLKLLKRQGLVDEFGRVQLNGEGHDHEHKSSCDHVHMTCLRCGKMSQFVSDSLDKLRQQVETDCRFKILVIRLEMGGYCATCRVLGDRLPKG